MAHSPRPWQWQPRGQRCQLKSQTLLLGEGRALGEALRVLCVQHLPGETGGQRWRRWLQVGWPGRSVPGRVAGPRSPGVPPSLPSPGFAHGPELAQARLWPSRSAQRGRRPAPAEGADGDPGAPPSPSREAPHWAKVLSAGHRLGSGSSSRLHGGLTPAAGPADANTRVPAATPPPRPNRAPRAAHLPSSWRSLPEPQSPRGLQTVRSGRRSMKTIFYGHGAKPSPDSAPRAHCARAHRAPGGAWPMAGQRLHGPISAGVPHGGVASVYKRRCAAPRRPLAALGASELRVLALPTRQAGRARAACADCSTREAAKPPLRRPTREPPRGVIGARGGKRGVDASRAARSATR